MVKAKSGGDVFTNIGDLAIPFGLLFSLEAVKKATEKKRPATPRKAAQKGGKAHCVLCERDQSGGTSHDLVRAEIQKITADLKALLQM